MYFIQGCLHQQHLTDEISVNMLMSHINIITEQRQQGLLRGIRHMAASMPEFTNMSETVIKRFYTTLTLNKY